MTRNDRWLQFLQYLNKMESSLLEIPALTMQGIFDYIYLAGQLDGVEKCKDALKDLADEEPPVTPQASQDDAEA